MARSCTQMVRYLRRRGKSVEPDYETALRCGEKGAPEGKNQKIT
jgi:hypothetical protein